IESMHYDSTRKAQKIVTLRSVILMLLVFVAIASGNTTRAQQYTLKTLVSFDGTNGANPYAGLLADANGNLFGTTEKGGASNLGTVFEVTASTHTLTSMASFNGANGRTADGGLVADAEGNLYGVTQHGGANNFGAVYELVAGANTLTTLASFSPIQGYDAQD